MCIHFMSEMEGVRSDMILLDIKSEGLRWDVPMGLGGVRWARCSQHWLGRFLTIANCVLVNMDLQSEI
jgi:hypothetical protein